MKLHELSPAPGSTKEVKRIGRGHGSVTVRPQVRVTRVRTPAAAAAYASVLKAVRCR